MSSDICVYSSTGSYTITATGSGSGAPGAYIITSNGNDVIYSVIWNAGGATHLANTGSTLTTGAASPAGRPAPGRR